MTNCKVCGNEMNMSNFSLFVKGEVVCSTKCGKTIDPEMFGFDRVAKLKGDSYGL